MDWTWQAAQLQDGPDLRHLCGSRPGQGASPLGPQEERGSPPGLPTWGTTLGEWGPGETATGAGCESSLQKVIKDEPTVRVKVPWKQLAACPAVLAARLCILYLHFSHPSQVGRPLPGSRDPLLTH